MSSLWGAGVYGLSEEGRSRFGDYPDVVAEDLYVDQHFDEHEIEIVSCAPLSSRPHGEQPIWFGSCGAHTVAMPSSALARMVRATGRRPAKTTREIFDLALEGPV